MRMSLATLMFLASAAMAGADVVGKEVSYTGGGVTMKGYLAYDDSLEGKRPGVLVVHEWWGHNAYARKRADMLAEMGYTALAVDMYGDGTQAKHPDDAGKFAGEVRKNLPAARERFKAAMDLLQAHETVDAENIAAIGYCFGGGIVIQMARDGMPLKGVVSFHGSLGTDEPAQPGAVKAKILVCHGADDPFVPEPAVETFKEEMDTAGADYEFVAYEGAVHSFTNPDADALAKEFGMEGIGYSAEADTASWNDMKAFLAECFGTK